MTLNQSISLAAIFAVLAFLCFSLAPDLTFGFKVVSLTWGQTALTVWVYHQLIQSPKFEACGWTV